MFASTCPCANDLANVEENTLYDVTFYFAGELLSRRCVFLDVTRTVAVILPQGEDDSIVLPHHKLVSIDGAEGNTKGD